MIFSQKYVISSLYYNNKKFQADALHNELFKLSLEDMTDISISTKKKETQEQQLALPEKERKGGLEGYLNSSPLHFKSIVHFSKFCNGELAGLDKRSKAAEKDTVDPPTVEKLELVNHFRNVILDRSPEELFYKVSDNNIAVNYTFITKEEKKLQIRQIERNDLFKKFSRKDVVEIKI